MKKHSFRIFTCLCVCFALTLCGCNEEKIEPAYDNSAVTLSSFTEIAGENPDNREESDGICTYTYCVADLQVGATAYNLYKDYLDENFTYSKIDSTYAEDGTFCAVYSDKNGNIIKFSEKVDEEEGYIITVSYPVK